MTVELPHLHWTANAQGRENRLHSFQSHCYLGFLSLAAKCDPNTYVIIDTVLERHTFKET